MPWYLVDVVETTQRSISYRIFRETEEEARKDAAEAGGFHDEDDGIEVVDEDHDLPMRTEVINCEVESSSPKLVSDDFQVLQVAAERSEEPLGE